MALSGAELTLLPGVRPPADGAWRRPDSPQPASTTTPVLLIISTKFYHCHCRCLILLLSACHWTPPKPYQPQVAPREARQSGPFKHTSPSKQTSTNKGCLSLLRKLSQGISKCIYSFIYLHLHLFIDLLNLFFICLTNLLFCENAMLHIFSQRAQWQVV